MIPAYLRDALIAAGHLTPDGLGRAAQLRTCPRCRQWVVVGQDHHRAAITATCDPIALDRLGECAAVLAGRATYELTGRELDRRDQWKIRGGMRKPVIGEHQCGIAKAPMLEILRLFVKAKPPPTNKEEPVPF